MSDAFERLIDDIAEIGLIGFAVWALVGVVVLLTAVTLSVLLRRFTAAPWQRRKDRLAGQTRPLLLEILADDEPDPDAVARLSKVSDRVWRVSEPTVVAMLGKVRGSSRDALVDLLEQRGALQRATKAARSRSSVSRCGAAELLGAARSSDSLPVLLELLDDRSAEVRRVAARALGRIGSAEATRPLLEAATGPRRLTPRDAASALVLLEPAATAIISRSVEEATDPQLREVGAEVLGLRGAVETADLLVRLVQHDESESVRLRAARALGRLGVRSAAAPLATALESTSGELRAVAAYALGQLGSETGVVRLAGCLRDPSHRVAANAAEAMAALGTPGLIALKSVAESGRERESGYAREALAVHALGKPGG